MEKSTIRTRQRWVLEHPAQSLQDCGKLGYRADITLGGQKMATVLLIPVFKHPLFWDAQIGLLGPDGQAIPKARWTRTDLVCAIAQAQRLLEDVGREEYRTEEDALSIILSKRLTVDEEAKVLNYDALNPIQPALVGEIGVYDFSKKSQVSDNGFMPIHRSTVYERRN